MRLDDPPASGNVEGVWGYPAGTMQQLDSGDIAAALNAATAIGNDRG